MAEGDNWRQTNQGLIFPDPRPTRSDRLREEMREEVREEVAWEMARDQYRANLVEQISSGNVNAGGLGLNEYNWDRQLGEGGLAPGAGPEVLRILAQRLTALQSSFYGGQFGFGYDSSQQEQGDALQKMSSLIWVFPEYNPLIKQMVQIRGLYVFGQGYEIRGESKKVKMQKIQQIRQEKQMLQMQGMQMQQDTEQGQMQGQDDASQALANNAMMQRYGGTGRAPRIPP